MGWRLTFVLILLNLAAFATLYWLQLRQTLHQKNAEGPSMEVPLNAEIQKLDIALSNGKRYIIKRNGKHDWEIVQPIRWPGNRNAIEHLLSQLRFVHANAVLNLKDIEETGQTLEDFGLENPAITLDIYTERDTRKRFSIGAPAQVGKHLYIAEENSQNIVVVNQHFLESLRLSPRQLRSESIFNIPSFQVGTLTIEVGESKISLVKSAKQWEFKTPVAFKADNDSVGKMLRILVAERPVKILQEENLNSDATGLKEPWMRVTLEGERGTDVLWVGNRLKNDLSRRYARLEGGGQRSPLVVESLTFEQLGKALEILRERKVLHFNHANSLIITKGPKKITLQKLEKQENEPADKWNCIFENHKGQINTTRASTEHVEALLKELDGLKASEFVSNAPGAAELKTWELENPLMSVDIKSKEGTPSLLIGGIREKTKEGPSAYAKISGEKTVYLVSLESIKLITANYLYFKNRTLEVFPKGMEILNFSIKNLKTEETVWSFKPKQAPNTQESEKNAVSKILVKLLQAPKVKDYLTDQPEKLPKDTWIWQLEVNFKLPNETKTVQRTYRFNKRFGARQLGVYGSNLVFTLRREWLEALDHLVFEKQHKDSAEDIKKKAEAPQKKDEK